MVFSTNEKVTFYGRVCRELKKQNVHQHVK